MPGLKSLVIIFPGSVLYRLKIPSYRLRIIQGYKIHIQTQQYPNEPKRIQ